MKKLLSFTILFIPWIISFILLPFTNIKISLFLMYFFFISFLFYIYISLFIYNKLLEEDLSTNFILAIVILYILNQSFNILVLYYNYYLLSFIFGIFSFIPILFLYKNYK